MEYLIVAIFATVQAITEFVPISSSGHLVILHQLIPSFAVDELRFDVMLHAGTLLAVVTYFYRDIAQLAVAWVQSMTARRRDLYARLAWLLLLATIPAALVGYLFEKIIETYLRSELVVAVMLVAVGVLFLVVERWARHDHELSSLRWPHALLIGCAQALALIPGTSRSGVTIIAGMAYGLKREAALRFSFLLSVPIILGATVTKTMPAGDMVVGDDRVLVYVVGFIIAWVLGYVVITYLLRFVRTHSLAVFAYYRFALAAVLLFLYLL